MEVKRVMKVPKAAFGSGGTLRGCLAGWRTAQFKRVNYEVPPEDSEDLLQNLCASTYVSIVLHGIVRIIRGAEWIITITPPPLESHL